MIFVIFERKDNQTMKTEKQVTGRLGEEESCRYLKKRGHFILARNWRAGHVELDIVTLLGCEVHFVEVKTRNEPVTADPLVNAGRGKRRCMIRAATAFMHAMERNLLPPDPEICFDIITVVFNNKVPKIKYYPKAFIPIYV